MFLCIVEFNLQLWFKWFTNDPVWPFSRWLQYIHCHSVKKKKQNKNTDFTGALLDLTSISLWHHLLPAVCTRLCGWASLLSSSSHVIKARSSELV